VIQTHKDFFTYVGWNAEGEATRHKALQDFARSWRRRVEDRAVIRGAPAIEQVTEARDAREEALESSEIDDDGAVRRSMANATKAVVKEPPDPKVSTTQVRIALVRCPNEHRRLPAGAR